MKHLFTLLLTCSALLWTTTSNAQIAFGFNYNHTVPLDTYKENLHRNPQGILISVLVKTKKNENLSIGGEFGLAMYADDNYFYELPSGEFTGELIEMYEEDCFLTYNAIARYSFLDEARLSPYVQATVGGLSFFSTRMTANEEDENYFESITKFHGTSLMTGLGAGTTFRIHPQVLIDLGAFYNAGTRADYRSIEPGDATFKRSLDYGKYSSNVSSLSFKIGLLCGF